MKLTGKSYTSVVDMVRATVGNTEAFSLERYIEARKVVNQLVALRCSKGLTQVEVAKRMGCGQSRVSKIERSTDHQVGLKALERYAAVLDMEMNVIFTPIKEVRNE
jgi:predicted XRE-type DNA-binding protein